MYVREYIFLNQLHVSLTSVSMHSLLGQGVAGDKEVFDPNNGDRKKEQRKFSKSKVHQKFSERSQTYKQGKGGG